MQHVRIRQHPAGMFANPVPLVQRGVAVEQCRPHARLGHQGELAKLISGQGLGRRQIENACPLVGVQGGQSGKLVRERLAGRSSGCHDDGPALVGQVGGDHLVGPRSVDASFTQRPANRRRNPVRPVRAFGRPGRKPLDVSDAGSVVLAAAQQAQQLTGPGRRDRRRLPRHDPGHRFIVSAGTDDPPPPRRPEHSDLPSAVSTMAIATAQAGPECFNRTNDCPERLDQHE